MSTGGEKRQRHSDTATQRYRDIKAQKQQRHSGDRDRDRDRQACRQTGRRIDARGVVVREQAR